MELFVASDIRGVDHLLKGGDLAGKEVPVVADGSPVGPDGRRLP